MSMSEVRSMTGRDVSAMQSVLQEEELAAKRAQGRAGFKRRG